MFGPVPLGSKIHDFRFVERLDKPRSKNIPSGKTVLYRCKNCGLEGEVRDYEGNDWVECEFDHYSQARRCTGVVKPVAPKKKTLKNIMQSFDI